MNFDYKEVLPSTFNKDISVPSSKSFANRALILAALVKEEVRLKNIPLSTDVENMLCCMTQVGLVIEREGRDVIIKNSFPECETKEIITLKTGDGGTTNRFLIPFLALGKSQYNIVPTGKMKERPMSELFDILKNMKVSFLATDYWCSFKGPLSYTQKIIDVDCSQTTQFATGLSLALAFREVEVNPVNMKTSMSYWEMSQEIIRRFKDGERVFDVPVDFSSISYPVALGLCTGSVCVENCRDIDSFQADSILFSFIKEMGANFSIGPKGLKIEKQELKGKDFDCSNCPDLVPTLCYIASCSKGKTRLKNVENLEFKESDRINETLKILKAFGVSCSYDNGIIEVVGPTPLYKKRVCLDLPDDHRMIMIAYLFMRTHSGGSMSNWESVNKSFSNFFDVME